MTGRRLDGPGDLYATTAVAAPPTPPLTGQRDVDVAIVGGGYTGLSAALHLAEQGVAVALLEAGEPGWGAAGRNGGQVNAGLKHEPLEVERRFGPGRGARVVRLAGEAPDLLFALIGRLGLACEADRRGTLRAAYGPRSVAALRSSVAQWRDRGATLEFWDAERMAAATGSARYVAGVFDPRGGSVNPLGLARGLAAAALRAGAAIHGDSRALRLERDADAWRLTTAGGTLRAPRVILATDGYSDGLWPGLATSIVPIYSSIAATEPLPAALAARLLPGGEVVYETGNVTVYYRRDRAHRLLMGGRGRQRPVRGPADFAHLRAYAARLWPELAGVAWTHGWNGQFALTPDFYPRLHAPAPGILIALGYSGRGVALATSMGRELAAAATGTPLEELALPVTPIPRLRGHRYWRVGVTLGVVLGRLRDRLGR